MTDYRGKVVLVVNTASECGFTPQYADLERLWQDYRDRGLVVLGFPSNDFGQQEPGTSEEIRGFCDLNFHVTFPMFAKIEVNGDNTHPLYQLLKKEAPGLLGTQAIKWNFTKFLVDANGAVVDRYGSNVAPKELEPIIDKLLV